MEKLQAFFVEGHQLICFLPFVPKFFDDPFFCSLEVKKGHIWPAGHRLATLLYTIQCIA